jgi:hypothetical protein
MDNVKIVTAVSAKAAPLKALILQVIYYAA